MLKKTPKPETRPPDAETLQALLEKGAVPAGTPELKLHRFLHFWVLVGKSFVRNRCPVRASALSYATLLALVPMLAVVMSITSTFLKKEGEERIDQFIVKLVASVTTTADLGTNLAGLAPNPGAEGATGETNPAPGSTALPPTGATGPKAAGETPKLLAGQTNHVALPAFAQAEDAVKARRAVARQIHEFIQNTRSGALGVTGSVLLIFAAISMLSRIEDTFNDIWGVARGRSWFTRVVLYWGVLSLAPMLLIVALGLASGPHLHATRKLIEQMPAVGNLAFGLLPAVVLCLAFALFYLLIPNTRVHWRAALAGGLVGGLLFHLNNAVSVLYVSRVVSNSRIYGSLGLVPVFMIGLYFAWLILLFGAQVAYAFQNRATYVEEKQVEGVNQRGREFIALRVMTCIGQRFERGESAPSVAGLAEELSVPSRLVQQVVQTLAGARLVVETAGPEPAFLPARPLENINCHNILVALRAGQGQELATRDEPMRAEVYGEFNRILEAERKAASSITMLALANRAPARLLKEGGKEEV